MLSFLCDNWCKKTLAICRKSRASWSEWEWERKWEQEWEWDGEWDGEGEWITVTDVSIVKVLWKNKLFSKHSCQNDRKTETSKQETLKGKWRYKVRQEQLLCYLKHSAPNSIRKAPSVCWNCVGLEILKSRCFGNDSPSYWSHYDNNNMISKIWIWYIFIANTEHVIYDIDIFIFTHQLHVNNPHKRIKQACLTSDV